MRLRQQMARLVWRTLLVAGITGFGLACVPQTQAMDPYFRKTRSDANVYVAPINSSIHKVAVLPFKAPTELIGSSGSDIFVTEMLRARRYTLVERSQMSGVLGETEMALSGLSESAAIEAGRMMGADGVILGTVDEYGTLAYRGRSYPVVGASIRLIDCNSGRVMWSVGHARRADSAAETLSGHARDVIHEMVSALVQNWSVQRQVEEEYDEPYGDQDQAEDLIGYDAPVAAPERIETPPPDPLDAFSASDLGLREVTLKWDSEGTRGLKVRIERAEAPDGPFVPLTTIPTVRGSYTDKTGKRNQLRDAASYYYRLVTIARDGKESDPTIALESMTAPPPNPPVDLIAEATEGRELSLEWSAPQCEGIVNYLVERALVADEVFTQVGDVNGTFFSEGGTAASPLRDSTTYLYRVRAVNRVGAVGEASDPIEIETLPPPDAATGLMAVSLEVRCVPLEWDIHPDEDIVRYEIYRADSDVGPFEYIGSSDGLENTSYLDGGRDPGSLEDEHVYFYCIRAINAVTAESDDSEVVMAATRPPPPIIEGLAVVIGLPRRVELMWEESSDKKVIGYEIDRAEDGGEPQSLTRVNGLEDTEYTDTVGEQSSRFMRSSVKTPMKDGTAYAYRVRAINTAEAVSEWCDAVEATTKVIPRAPTGLKVTEGRASVIGLVWAANTEDDIAEYVVEISASAGGHFSEVGRVEAGGRRGFKQEALPPGLTRSYRLQAVDVDGLRGTWSESVEGFTKPLPDAPTDLEVEWSGDGVLLTWSPPPQDDIVQYRILNKRFMGQDNLATSDTAEHFFPIEMMAKKKVMMIIAIDEDGLESPASKPIQVRKPR